MSSKNREGIEDRVILGDCLDVLKTFENNYVDSIVSDPP